ncbi:Imm26 family immunity protein [Streptomyces sp. NPDC048491]|uniref:Imm26 family immunity protein n=1 Tax=unclassified Streptomyces TaxID=2593676 RepID=UPI003431A9C8
MSVRFTAGGILRLLLPDGQFAYGVMLGVRPYMAFYKDLAVGEELTSFEQDPLFIIAVHNSAYSKGRWGSIVSRAPKESLPSIPSFFRQDVLNRADCVIVDADGKQTVVSPVECVGLERSAVWSAEHIEARIEDIYAERPNRFVESMRVKQ